ncbi:inactive rhomboid protein 1-like [Oscarella lobularis]|uniref:inactive rhomboid protein 1-like n=1 Tax=Oscarella lobularis TaxID=121494 RepID=UPI003313A1A5
MSRQEEEETPLKRRRMLSLRGRIPERSKKEKVSWKKRQWWKDRLKEFFGIEDDEEDRKVWQARRRLHMKQRWLIATRPDDDDDDDDDVDGGGDGGIPMEKQRLTTEKTGRKRVIGKAPEHRIRPPMPSVFSMVVSGIRTLVKPKPAPVGHPAPPVHEEARSFVPDEDSDEASDISDDGRSYFGADDRADHTDGGRIEPAKAIATSVELTGSRPPEDVIDGSSWTPARENRRTRGLRRDDLLRKASNDNRRRAGIGIVGRWFNRTYKDYYDLPEKVIQKIKDPEIYRPYFTWWLMTVQVIVLIVSMAVYGVAPIGFEFKTKQAQIMTTSLAIESRGYAVEQNFWIGPSYENLILLGAKFAPCMRRDRRVFDAIDRERRAEIEDFGCCVRLDRAGCVYVSSNECSKSLFTEFIKYNVTYPGRGKNENVTRTSGPLCKEAPRVCSNPQSSGVSPPWKNDVSKWATCRNFFSLEEPQLECQEVTGRPCCVGIQGECIMATKDECDFYDGFFHEDERLCADVDCMEDICGLTDFLHPNEPDQIYRIWISLFLHVGVIHCIISLVVEFIIGRDIEKLAGWYRMMIIFVFSGVGGNIVSAFFTPYQAEVGPSGAIFGLFAALIMDVIQQWNIIVNPVAQLLKLALILIILFVLGLLPYVDNYAHVGGFIFGLLLSASFLPSIGTKKRTKIIMIAVCLPVCIALLVLFFLLFYLVDLNCDGCKYFTCIPVTDTFCLDLDHNLRQRFFDERAAV